MSIDTILLMLSMLACTQVNVKQQNRHFKILQATSQERVSGVQGGGRGINYRMTIKINTNRPIIFDSIWVSGKNLGIKFEQEYLYPESKLAKNDTVVLLASDYISGPGKVGNKQQGHPSFVDSAKAPIEYKGAGLLRYRVDDKVNYAALPDIKVLPAIYGQ